VKLRAAPDRLCDFCAWIYRRFLRPLLNKTYLTVAVQHERVFIDAEHDFPIALVSSHFTCTYSSCKAGCGYPCAAAVATGKTTRGNARHQV
jgi:hypothetical protein